VKVPAQASFLKWLIGAVEEETGSMLITLE
jgi:hypothetical protein